MSAPAESDLFTFTGSAGDLVAFTLVETNSWGITSSDARVTLFSPAGAEILTFDSESQPEFTLPATGTYLVRVSANNLVATGSYNLGLEGIVPASPNPTALVCNGIEPGSISQVGETDVFTFQGNASDMITLTITETTSWGITSNDARATVFSPVGTQLTFFDSDGSSDVTLGETGTHIVFVSANTLLATGSYELGLQCN